MSIEDRLTATNNTSEHAFRRQSHTPGAKFEWNGSSGYIETGALEDRPKTWDEFIKQFGLDPEEVEVVEPVKVRAWDAAVGNGETKQMQHFTLTLQKRGLRADIEELINAAKNYVFDTTPLEPVDGAQAYVVALGDLQIGKVDGDGAEGTVARFLASTERAIERYKQLREDGWAGPIYLIHLGDCIEGFVSQGGALSWRVSMTLTEQFRVYRRILLEQVMAFADITDELYVIGIPGNHDEANRPLMTYGDSWAIEAVSAVQDTLKIVPGYEHVRFICPARDELTVTIDIGGTIVGLAHGHQWRAGQAEKWWADQSHGRQPIGDADILLSAHLHHLRVTQSGVKTWIQVPALESESTWYRHRAGMVSPPGIVTMLVGDGNWSSLEIL